MTELSTYSQTSKVLALVRYAGIGPRLFELLINRYTTLDGILSADEASLRSIDGITDTLVDQIIGARNYLEAAGSEETELLQRDIRIITRLEEEYPTLLEELNDPPPLLYARGNVPRNDRRSVTLVGAAEASSEGMELTVNVAGKLADAGVQIISSLRMGIDAAVHLGSKAIDYHSFAVVESGFDHIDRTVEVPLAIDTVQTGGIISEHPPDTPYSEEHYRAANRLLVGLGQAVVLTELYKESDTVMDLVLFCSQIGKLTFLVVDPDHGALSDEEALGRLTEYGVIPIVGLNDVDKIIAALV